jgi:hypothetical protein
MPVPDLVYFGPDQNGHGLNYGQIRALGEEEQFRALQRRLNTLFIGQVDELAKIDNERRLVYAPFPLFLLTCVGIEALGKVFFNPGQGQQEEIQRDGFLKVCTKINKAFSRPLAKDAQADYDQLWGAGSFDKHKVKSVGHIIYRFGRHTMIHGYQGRGVYLTEDQSVSGWKVDGGAVIMNPYWFWENFQKASAELWEEFHENKEPTNALKKSARIFLQEMLQ